MVAIVCAAYFFVLFFVVLSGSAAESSTAPVTGLIMSAACDALPNYLNWILDDVLVSRNDRHVFIDRRGDDQPVEWISMDVGQGLYHIEVSWHERNDSYRVAATFVCHLSHGLVDPYLADTAFDRYLPQRDDADSDIFVYAYHFSRSCREERLSSKNYKRACVSNSSIYMNSAKQSGVSSKSSAIHISPFMLPGCL